MIPSTWDANIRHPLEKGKTSASRQLSYPNPIRLWFQSVFFDFGIFLNVFKPKNVNVLNLKKIQKQGKMCSWRHHFVFDVFQIEKIHFFYVWKRSKTSLNQKVSMKIKVSVVWRKKVAGWRDLFTIPSGWRISAPCLVHLLHVCTSIQYIYTYAV